MHTTARRIAVALAALTMLALAGASLVSLLSETPRIYDGTAGDGINHRAEVAREAVSMSGEAMPVGYDGDMLVTDTYASTDVTLPDEYAHTDGSRVSPGEAVPGDLVLMDYGTTTGVYIGGGEAVVVRDGYAQTVSTTDDLTTIYVSVDL